MPTSDQDELEEFAATTSTRTYWSRNASDIARRREVPKSSTAQQHDELSVSSSDMRSRSSPPRKRRKVCMEIVFGSVPVLNPTAGQYPGWWSRVNASLTAHQYPRCFACDRGGRIFREVSTDARHNGNTGKYRVTSLISRPASSFHSPTASHPRKRFRFTLVAAWLSSYTRHLSRQTHPEGWNVIPAGIFLATESSTS